MTSRNFWYFLTPPVPIVTLFSNKALVLLSQNLHTPPLKAVTSFMDGLLEVPCLKQKKKQFYDGIHVYK